MDSSYIFFSESFCQRLIEAAGCGVGLSDVRFDIMKEGPAIVRKREEKSKRACVIIHNETKKNGGVWIRCIRCGWNVAF